MLRGRCRTCGEPISFRYPLVEATSGALWALAGAWFGISLRAGFAVLFFYLLLILSAIDLDVMRLPNVLVTELAVGGAVGALAAEVSGVPAVPLVGMSRTGALSHPLAAAASGAALGAGVVLLIALAYGAVRRKAGMGMGDVKLLAAMGVFLGPYVLLALVLGTLVGSVGALLAVRKGGGMQTRMPFGPFLAAGGVLAAVLGPAMWAWYAGVAGL